VTAALSELLQSKSGKALYFAQHELIKSFLNRKSHKSNTGNTIWTGTVIYKIFTLANTTAREEGKTKIPNG
jgi:hypothetical protein